MTSLTPWQTVGPYFALALPSPGQGQPLSSDHPGIRIRIEGAVLDGDGQAVPDALIETWQADAGGRFPVGAAMSSLPPSFIGFARVPTDDAGRFSIDTVMPGHVDGPSATRQAPHLVVSVLARGLLGRLVTRAYFEGHPGNPTDPILGLVPEARRSTLIATGTAPNRFHFDIRLQGPNETVFFDV